jgi:hypothetical protein
MFLVRDLGFWGWEFLNFGNGDLEVVVSSSSSSSRNRRQKSATEMPKHRLLSFSTTAADVSNGFLIMLESQGPQV